jgi:hypothetical protein
MKKGDTVPVTINGAVIGNAVVEHVGETQVTLFVPAMRAVMGYRVELETQTPTTPESETVITGVDTPEVDPESATIHPVGPVNSEEAVIHPVPPQEATTNLEGNVEPNSPPVAGAVEVQDTETGEISSDSASGEAGTQLTTPPSTETEVQ